MSVFLSTPQTAKTSICSSSSTVPDKDETGPVNGGGSTIRAAAGESEQARRDDEERQEQGGEVGASQSNAENGRTECIGDEIKEEYIVRAGGVIFKPYHWQGTYMGPPVLTISTTGSRAARLQLKEGSVCIVILRKTCPFHNPHPSLSLSLSLSLYLSFSLSLSSLSLSLPLSLSFLSLSLFLSFSLLSLSPLYLSQEVHIQVRVWSSPGLPARPVFPEPISPGE